MRTLVNSTISRMAAEEMVDASTRADSVVYDVASANYVAYLSEEAKYRPVRSDGSQVFDESAASGIVFVVDGVKLADLVPNFYRSPGDYDQSRRPDTVASGAPVVSFPDRLDHPTRGLRGRHIAVWPSHGWYYEPDLDRWEWQRARLFQTVEDKFPLSFVLKYLLPMLESAGAEVYSPRERDIQANMVIVDHDGSTGDSQYLEQSVAGAIVPTLGTGFAVGSPPYEDGFNPFAAGTARRLPFAADGRASVSWIPDIPASGDYAVYLSYGTSPNACRSSEYVISHRGGETRVIVDQSRAPKTWVYAGTYSFDSGVDASSGGVLLTNDGASKCTVSADAVRFGGGTGNIIRGESTSGRPRYLEAARYNLQFSGAPDTLVYDLSSEVEDYRDDYRSRGEWVNWLRGAPFGPNKDRASNGLNIPIDLSLAFHTDAGVTAVDSSIGTLSIYSTTGFDSTRAFPDGVSRMANRDFADILQTQIVEDIRAIHDPDWRRRALWDRDYSEAVRPNVPSALLELLSHQNFYDMQFGLDPGFQSDVARSIYKAILRFLATQYQVEYVVQPLPVTHFSATLNGDHAILTWMIQEDELEPTALPTNFLVQSRVGNGVWDEGRIVDTTTIVAPVPSPDVVYSFRILAINSGGRSRPSEVLAVARSSQVAAPTIRIVNGFDRVSAPAWFASDQYGGFAHWLDEGVPDGYDISYTGPQYDFSATSPWLDDDAPGFGASHASLEGRLVAGNTRDFVRVHGRAALSTGYSFDSASDEAVIDGSATLGRYPAVDLLLGEEKATPRPKHPDPQFKAIPRGLQDRLRDYQASGGAILATGAYVAGDLAYDSLDTAFAHEVLHVVHRTNYASTTGETYGVRNPLGLALPESRFETRLNERLYSVEAPNAIEPAPGAVRVLRYADTNMSAGVVFVDDKHRTAVLGFPLEAVTSDEARTALVGVLLNFLLEED